MSTCEGLGTSISAYVLMEYNAGIKALFADIKATIINKTPQT